MTPEQFLFVQAIEAFKRVNGKTFPTWTDVLEVVRRLGYRKTQPSDLQLGTKAEDWTVGLVRIKQRRGIASWLLHAFPMRSCKGGVLGFALFCGYQCLLLILYAQSPTV